MAGAKMWTRADARAEMARTIAATLDARRTLHRATGVLRKIGDESDFKDDAAKAVALLHRGAIGEGARVWIDRTCKECGFEYATREGPVGPFACPGCTTKTMATRIAKNNRYRDGAPEWWDKIEKISRTLEGCMIVPFDRDSFNRDQRVSISNSPHVFVEPRYLIVDPTVGAGRLEVLQVGNESLIVGNGHSPLSLFNPLLWKNPETMLHTCTLQSRRISPAHRVTLVVTLDEPGPFRALMWCRAFDTDGNPF